MTTMPLQSSVLSTYNFDLHIHTPTSLCYADKSVSPKRIVEAALTAGIDAIAITDHNTVSAVDGIRQAAKNRNLTVFPGVELSTPGGHVIGLFDINIQTSQVADFLQQLGVLPDAMGDGARQVSYPIESVFEKIHRSGGVAIAAHIERWPSGFLESSMSRKSKMDAHASPFLSALEITIPRNREKWNRGTMRGYPKKYACIQSSDAHALNEIGRRFVSIQMERVSLAGLKAAFSDYENSIVFNAT
jgi:predicted metal-dependent phosphoesterase TrpH